MAKDLDPVEEYLDELEKQAAVRQKEDLRLWQAWQQGGRSTKQLEPLLKRYEPTLTFKARSLSGASNIQESALRADLKSHAIDAFRSYDPSRASLRTHVNNRLRKSLRFLKKHQNLAYIPEAKTELIGPIQRSKDALHGQLGRPPTVDEIADHMRAQPGASKLVRGITPAKIQEIQKANVKDVLSSQFPSDPTPQQPSRRGDVVSLLRPALTPDEQAVFDLMETGLKPGQVARKLKKPPHTISRLRTSINRKYQRYT
jgi:DNA-directed RNA polymerase specialized sigma subunit